MDQLNPPIHERPESSEKAPVYRVAVIQMYPKVNRHRRS